VDQQDSKRERVALNGGPAAGHDFGRGVEFCRDAALRRNRVGQRGSQEARTGDLGGNGAVGGLDQQHIGRPASRVDQALAATETEWKRSCYESSNKGQFSKQFIFLGNVSWRDIPPKASVCSAIGLKMGQRLSYAIQDAE